MHFRTLRTTSLSSPSTIKQHARGSCQRVHPCMRALHESRRNVERLTTPNGHLHPHKATRMAALINQSERSMANANVNKISVWMNTK